MIDHVWTVLCSRSVIDIETNNVSIQDVIEQLNIPGDPKPDGLLAIPFEIISLWARSESKMPKQGLERITFITPSEKSTIVAESPIDLSTAERQRNRIKFPGLPIAEEGRHYFQIEYKQDDDSEWIKATALPISIQFDHKHTPMP
ncbi:MAG: hypothetical protein IH589_09785 [Anaerolineales bacterium]|nr:hypothetical protein [Anaerolineales bacterium]